MSGHSEHVAGERPGASASGRLGLWLCAAAVGALWSGMAQAQTGSAIDAAQRQRVEQQLNEIKASRQDMAQQMGDMDARIRALEVELHGVAAPPAASVAAPSPAPTSIAAAPAGDVQPASTQQAESDLT